MTPLVVNGTVNVSLTELRPGDQIRLVGDEPNTVAEVVALEDGRAYLRVQTSVFADPVKVWLRRHSLVQLHSSRSP